jgi:hypothetical protein
MPQLITKILGSRPKQSAYQYDDVIMNWIYSVLCDCYHLNGTTALRSSFTEIPGIKFPSHDVIGRVFKSLATPNIVFHREEGKKPHEMNLNIPMNELLIATACKLGLLNQMTGYTLDFDATVVATEKADSQFTYKQFFGYNPSVAFLGNSIPVFIEGKSGATHAAFKMADTLGTIMELLSKQNVKVARLRSDAAAFSQSVVEFCTDRGIEFFIRAKRSKGLYEQLEHVEWTPCEIGHIPQELASIRYDFGGKDYRVVVHRRKLHGDDKTDDTGYLKDGYMYRSIMTNNYTMSDEQVIRFYAKRGAVERNFTNLNEFNFENLPFSYLNENCVFMIVCAMGYVMYQHLLRKFSGKLPWIRKNLMPKTFIKHFIFVTMIWVVENGIKVAELDSDGIRDYSPLYSRPPS